jgi:putative cardiolipin synthase
LYQAWDRLDQIIGNARETQFSSEVRTARMQNFSQSTLKRDWVPAKMYSDPPSKAGGSDKGEEILASQSAMLRIPGH